MVIHARLYEIITAMSDSGKHAQPARILIAVIIAILATVAGIWSANITLDRRVNPEEPAAT